MKLSKRIRRSTVYGFTKTVLWFFNVIPRGLANFLGGWIGLAAWAGAVKERHRIHRHLTLAYGDRLTGRQRAVIGRRFFVNSGRNFSDVVRFTKHYQTELHSRVTCEGIEHFDAAYRAGKGLIGITGHLGNFELLAAYIQNCGYDVAVIGREMYDQRLNRLLIANREAVGLTNIATTDSPKRLLRWLRDGKALGVLIDTDSHRVRGMFLPAWGRWSHTPVGQTIMGLKTGAAFIPMACLRMDNDTYKVVIKPAIEVKPSGDFDTDVYNVTLACTKALEKIINEHPDQWIWLHNRWRTRLHPA
ncbi:MAG: lysophospholipid acyltransferase family protein [candidate division Zixibacteria bacterium]|nr:lysophospholipid acyltransferase family protein [candidate division Zixibacteria bacterium]